MIWPFTRSRIQPGERPYVCPDCKTLDPAMPIAILVNWVLRDGVIVAIPTGQTGVCRRCGATFDITPNGTILVESRSRSFVAPTNEPYASEPELAGYRPERPMPKEKPPV